MCELTKPKKLTFEKEIGMSSKLQIKPLLSKKVERSENLQFKRIKSEFTRLYVSPVQIKTESQNDMKVKTDCVTDEKVAAEHGPDNDPPCSQLTNEADIRNAQEKIF